MSLKKRVISLLILLSIVCTQAAGTRAQAFPASAARHDSIVQGATTAGSDPTAVELILHYFYQPTNGIDGANPQCVLIQGSDGALYGTTTWGGPETQVGSGIFGSGTIFKVTTTGMETVLHDFDTGTVIDDGAQPTSGLVLGTDGNYYGTTTAGGSAAMGSVFRMAPSGAITILHSFGDGSITDDGLWPNSGLIEASDGNYYGTTVFGGSTGTPGIGSGYGTVFKMTPAGSVTILHSFGDGSVENDGIEPSGSGGTLIQGRDGYLYGVTTDGGATVSSDPNHIGYGTLYRMSTSGHETILHSFGDETVAGDGLYPTSVIQGLGSALYGTTRLGGTTISTDPSGNGYGTVFKMTLTGSEVVLHDFSDGTVESDGIWGHRLIQAKDGNFYGTTSYGGSTRGQMYGGDGCGTVFRMTPAGAVSILHSFSDGSVPSDGTGPEISLMQAADGDFYGTTDFGGGFGGTVFRLLVGVAVESLSLGRTTIHAGTSTTCTVTLSQPAPAFGALVTLSNSNSAVAVVPMQVFVAAGKTTKVFTVAAGASLTAEQTTTLSAAYKSTDASVILTVEP